MGWYCAYWPHRYPGGYSRERLGRRATRRMGGVVRSVLFGLLLVLAAAAVVVVVGVIADDQDRDLNDRTVPRGETLPFAVFGRPFGLADHLPSGSKVENVLVDTTASRRLTRQSGYVLWGAVGASTERADWSVGLDPTDVCLYVRGRRGMLISVNCAPVAVASIPGGLSTIVSGGAAGAPGFRPREFVYAAVLPDGVSSAQLLFGGDVVQSIPIRDNGLLIATRRRVDTVRFETQMGLLERPINACQNC